MEVRGEKVNGGAREKVKGCRMAMGEAGNSHLIRAKRAGENFLASTDATRWLCPVLFIIALPFRSLAHQKVEVSTKSAESVGTLG